MWNWETFTPYILNSCLRYIITALFVLYMDSLEYFINSGSTYAVTQDKCEQINHLIYFWIPCFLRSIQLFICQQSIWSYLRNRLNGKNSITFSIFKFLSAFCTIYFIKILWIAKPLSQRNILFGLFFTLVLSNRFWPLLNLLWRLL